MQYEKIIEPRNNVAATRTREMEQDSEFYLDRFESERDGLLVLVTRGSRNHRHLEDISQKIHKAFSGGMSDEFWQQYLLALQEYLVELLYDLRSEAWLDELKSVVAREIDSYRGSRSLRIRQEAFHKLNFLFTNYWKLALDCLEPAAGKSPEFSVVRRIT